MDSVLKDLRVGVVTKGQKQLGVPFKEIEQGLSNKIINQIKPTYLKLCNETLLKKCLHVNVSRVHRQSYPHNQKSAGITSGDRGVHGNLQNVEIKVGITFQDGDRFNSCQVIYSQFGLAIHQNDHQARRRFVEWAQNEIAVVPDFHKRILFKDEAHFWLNGYLNKQNCRIWSEANPLVYVETPLHPEKLTVWCALWASGILLQKAMKATTLQSMVIGIEP
ncbi:hypothetical protein TNCV_651911 [Trichonephila clavipes]|nr:hypothetical protein TNCV_651911 [Trichonephila clavipes]